MYNVNILGSDHKVSAFMQMRCPQVAHNSLHELNSLYTEQKNKDMQEYICFIDFTRPLSKMTVQKSNSWVTW